MPCTAIWMLHRHLCACVCLCRKLIALLNTQGNRYRNMDSEHQVLKPLTFTNSFAWQAFRSARWSTRNGHTWTMMPLNVASWLQFRTFWSKGRKSPEREWKNVLPCDPQNAWNPARFSAWMAVPSRVQLFVYSLSKSSWLHSAVDGIYSYSIRFQNWNLLCHL